MIRRIVHLLAALALMCRAAAAAQTPLVDDYECSHPPYKVHMVSKSPLVIYITDFLTQAERDHLVEAS